MDVSRIWQPHCAHINKLACGFLMEPFELSLFELSHFGKLFALYAPPTFSMDSFETLYTPFGRYEELHMAILCRQN